MLERLTSPCTRRAKAHARDGRRLADKVIHLVGPGGAGKSTVGSALASRLDLLFIDLDLEFMEHIGDISHHIDHRGYHSYASENVRLCLSIMATPGRSLWLESPCRMVCRSRMTASSLSGVRPIVLATWRRTISSTHASRLSEGSSTKVVGLVQMSERSAGYAGWTLSG